MGGSGESRGEARRALSLAAAAVAVLLAFPLVARAADGKLTTAIATRNQTDTANGVAIQGDGKVSAVGGAVGSSTTGGDFTVVRYNTNGTLDTGFGGDGIVTTAIGPGNFDDSAKDVAIQGDGKIVVVGSTQ